LHHSHVNNIDISNVKFKFTDNFLKRFHIDSGIGAESLAATKENCE